MPSVVQKRLMANGRQAEITRTTAFFMLPARSLNLRVEVAHTAVSRLGTMLSTLRLPAKSFSDTSLRSLPTSVNAGAACPRFGNWPATSIGLPASVTVVIGYSLRAARIAEDRARRGESEIENEEPIAGRVQRLGVDVQAEGGFAARRERGFPGGARA